MPPKAANNVSREQGGTRNNNGNANYNAVVNNESNLNINIV